MSKRPQQPRHRATDYGAFMLFVTIATSVAAQAPERKKPPEQLLACMVDKVAGIDSKGAGERNPRVQRFTIRWTGAEQTYPGLIRREHILTSLGEGQNISYFGRQIDFGNVEKTSQRDWDNALSKLDRSDPRGIYESLGTWIWLSGSDDQIGARLLRRGERLRMSIAEMLGPNNYVSVGWCEPF